MRGIVLAGGLGTRLRPLTSVVNKHLLPIYNKPMIFYPLQMLADAGIEEAVVVIGGHSTEEIVKLCKDGREFGFKRLYYVYQEGEGGIAAALSLTEEFADGQDICVVLGDNLMLGDSLRPYVDAFDNRIPRATFTQRGPYYGAMVLLTKVPDPQNYGVPTIDEKGRILFITEKPEHPSLSEAVIGVYFYDKSVFSRIRACKPSERGELEVTDVNNSYAEEHELTYRRTKGQWIDAGSSIEAWRKAGELVEKHELSKEEYPELLHKC
jgi:glucose-1-phosphate thymidylyltransferase